MQEIEVVIQKLDRLQETLPEIRREALEEAGEQMLQLVRSRIGGQGKVQRWQDIYMGSGGGYSAVRALAKVQDKHGYAVGYVTNALESGHRQTPGRYVPAMGKRLKQTRVAGKHMYRDTQPDAEQLAAQAAGRIEVRMKEVLEE